MFRGSTSIKGVSLGDNPIYRVYLGNNQYYAWNAMKGEMSPVRISIINTGTNGNFRMGKCNGITTSFNLIRRVFFSITTLL